MFSKGLTRVGFLKEYTIAGHWLERRLWWVARLMRRIQAIRYDALRRLICDLPKHWQWQHYVTAINQTAIKRQIVHFNAAPVRGPAPH